MVIVYIRAIQTSAEDVVVSPKMKTSLGDIRVSGKTDRRRFTQIRMMWFIYTLQKKLLYF